jgi:hypothetical protein
METAHLQVSASVKTTSTPDGVVLLDIQGGMCFPLDAVGTFIWKGLEEHSSIEAIAQQIAETYQISLQQALADVRDFVEQLHAEHLVHDGSDKESVEAGGWISMVSRLCRRLARRRANGAESHRSAH